MIEAILELKQKISPHQELDLDYLLTDSLAYDGEFPKYILEQPKERNSYIEKNNLREIFKIELSRIEQIENDKLYGVNIPGKNLDISLIIMLITEVHWNEVYGTSARWVQIPIDMNHISNEIVLKNIAKLLFTILNKKPFLRFNFTRGLILINTLLNRLGYPSIYFAYKDRKRILRAIDYPVDFEKEFLLTLMCYMNKSYYETFSPGEIISFEEKKALKWIKHLYVKPWCWWRWKDDRIQYTVKDYLSSNEWSS